MLTSIASGCTHLNGSDTDDNSSLLLHYSLDESTGSVAKESVSGKDYKVNYVFNEENADSLFKSPTIL